MCLGMNTKMIFSAFRKITHNKDIKEVKSNCGLLQIPAKQWWITMVHDTLTVCRLHAFAHCIVVGVHSTRNLNFSFHKLNIVMAYQSHNPQYFDSPRVPPTRMTDCSIMRLVIPLTISISWCDGRKLSYLNLIYFYQIFAQECWMGRILNGVGCAKIFTLCSENNVDVSRDEEAALNFPNSIYLKNFYLCFSRDDWFGKKIRFEYPGNLGK